MQPQQPPGFSPGLGGGEGEQPRNVVEGTVVEGTVVQPAAQPVVVQPIAVQPVAVQPVAVQPQTVYGQPQPQPQPVVVPQQPGTYAQPPYGQPQGQPAAQPVFLAPEDVRARGLVVVQPQPVYGHSKVMPMPVHGQMMMMPQVVRPPGHWNGGQPCGCCDPPGGCPLCCITYWCPCAPVAELYDGVVRPGSYGEVFTILCIAPARAENHLRRMNADTPVALHAGDGF